MKKIMILIFTLFLSIQFSFAQKIKIPKNINEAIIALEIDCSDSLKTTIMKTDDDKLHELCQLLSPLSNESRACENFKNKQKQNINKKIYFCSINLN